MKNPILLVSLVILFCLAFGCQKQGKEVAKEPEATLEADVAAIKASFDEWVKLSNVGDLDRIMSIFYTDDSIQMPPNASASKGKDAILLGYQEYRKLNKDHWDSSVVQDVRVSDNLGVAWGIDTGTTTPRSGGEAVKFDLKWLTVLERQSDGTWKWIYEIWNDNNPRPETPAQQKTESVEQELIKLENEWADAWIKRDVAFFDRIEADDYTWTSPWGVWTKAQDLAELKSGDSVITSWVMDGIKVRVYGDAAVVTGRSTIKEMHKGEDWSRQESWTDTWIKRDGRWQCVAGHSSVIAQK
jgi:ketosteroid isomerase-like protein